MLLMAGPMIVLFERRHPDRPGRRQAPGQAGRGRALPRPARRRGLPAGRPPVRRWTTPRRRPTRSSTDVAVLISAAAGRGRAGVLADDCPAALRAAGLTPRCCRPRPARTPSSRPLRRSPPAPAPWSPSVGTAPCTPRCRPSPARRRRWPSSPRAPATTSPWPSASRATPLAAARAAADDLARRDAAHDRRRPDGRPLVGHGALLRLRLRRHRPGQPAALAAGPPPLRRRRAAELARLRPAS